LFLFVFGLMALNWEFCESPYRNFPRFRDDDKRDIVDWLDYRSPYSDEYFGNKYTSMGFSAFLISITDADVRADRSVTLVLSVSPSIHTQALSCHLDQYCCPHAHQNTGKHPWADAVGIIRGCLQRSGQVRCAGKSSDLPSSPWSAPPNADGTNPDIPSGALNGEAELIFCVLFLA